VLALARALAREAEVTVVFRRVHPGVEQAGCAVWALEPAGGSGDEAPSRRALGRFVEQHASRFAVVLEAGWSMPGKVAAWCAGRGVSGIPVIDALPATSWLGSLDPGTGWLGLGASGRYLRQAPVVIAGGPALRDVIVERWRVSPSRIAVIAPAIDRTLFAPRDQGEARRQLGMAPEHRVILAGDGPGREPDLTPLIEAVQRAGDPALRLHILGAGPRGPELARLAGRGPAVSFHPAPADDVLASYIAAADLCVSMGHSADPCFTVSECLSSGRPVAVAAAEGRLAAPVHHLVTGFEVEPDLLGWIRFLQRDCPSRNTLRIMGMTAGASPIENADRTAAAYLAAIERARHPESYSAAAV
jgi:hypothetical protein